jgi:MFS family permease
VVVGAAVLLTAGLLATPLCFGVFVKVLGREFGWSNAAVSGAMSVSMAVSGVVGILMGKVSDKYDTRIALGLGLVMGVGSFLLLARTESLWEFYLYFGVGIGICAGCGYSPVVATVSKWFVKRRAFAIAIALIGIVLGQMAFSPLADYVISSHGWRTAFLVMGVVTFVLALPGIILLSRRPAPAVRSTGPQHDVLSAEGSSMGGYSAGEAAKTGPFWMLIVTGFAMSAGYCLLIASVVPYAVDRGVSERAAALIVTVSAVGGLAGTFLAGWLAARLSARWALLVLLTVQTATLFAFMGAYSVWSFYLVAGLFGLVFGAGAPMRLSMVAPLFGLRAVGTVLGLTIFAWSCGGIFSPYFGGYIRDITGSYSLAFMACGVLLAVGMVSLVFWGEHKRVGRSDS